MKNQFTLVIIEWRTDKYEVIAYKRLGFTNSNNDITYKNPNNGIMYDIFDKKELDYLHRDNRPISTELLYSESYLKFQSLDAAKAWCEERAGEIVLITVKDIDEIYGRVISDKYSDITCTTNIPIPGTDVKRKFDLLTPDRMKDRPLSFGSIYHYFGGVIEKEKIRFHIRSDGMFTTEFTDPDGVVSKQPYLHPEIKTLLTKGLMWLGVVYLISVII